MFLEFASFRSVASPVMRPVRSWALFLLLLVAGSPAVHAQVADPLPAASRPGWMQLVGQVDNRTIAIVAAAIVVLIVLVWRVAVMIRRERPVALPAARPRRKTVDDIDAPGRATQRPTDWGFDQNKRAAATREPVAMPKTDADLPSLEMAATMWTASDVQHAGALENLPDDALGKSPNQAPSPYRTSFNPYFKRELPTQRMEVVEVADALLQAELLVQLGDPKQAMTLLSHHIRDTEKPGPASWLMLLNLYQSTGRESQYNALASGFKTLFNAEVPPWASSTDVAARDLESYLQVMIRLQATWPGAQARVALESFLNDDRGGSRQGFSLAAYRELLFLAEILDALEAIDVEEEERTGIRRKLDATS